MVSTFLGVAIEMTSPSRRQFLAAMAALTATKALPELTPAVAPPPRLQFHRDAFSFVWPMPYTVMPQRIDVLIGHADIRKP